MENQTNSFDSENINYNINNIDKMNGIEFEKLIKILSEKMGFDVHLTKSSGDGGIDLIAYNHQPSPFFMCNMYFYHIFLIKIKIITTISRSCLLDFSSFKKINGKITQKNI